MDANARREEAAAKRWTRATKEIAYITCEFCHEKIEVELDPVGRSIPWLIERFKAHFIEWHSEGQVTTFEQRWLATLPRTQTIDLDKPIDLSDIMSERAIERRAKDVSERHLVSYESALKLVRMKASQVVLTSKRKYACVQCGRYITRKSAESGGLGRDCQRQRQ